MEGFFPSFKVFITKSSFSCADISFSSGIDILNEALEKV